jgi:hypothetical protein
MTRRTVAWVSGIVLAAVLFTGCQPSRPRAEPSGPQQWDIDLVELILRRQINDTAPQTLSARKTVYLSVLGEDAPLELISRFRNSGLTVYRASEFKAGGGVQHRIDRIEQVGPTHAVVDASWYQNTAAAKDFRYQVEKVGGRWKIAQVTLIRG